MLFFGATFANLSSNSLPYKSLVTVKETYATWLSMGHQIFGHSHNPIKSKLSHHSNESHLLDIVDLEFSIHT